MAAFAGEAAVEHDDGVFHRLLIGVDALHDLEPKVTQRCGDQTGAIGRVGQRRLFIGAFADHERDTGRGGVARPEPRLHQQANDDQGKKL